MTASLSTLHLLLGACYVGLGALIAVEMGRNWSRMGFSHFGAVLVVVAFTCGPHHFHHGLHIATEGHRGVLDLIAVAVGLPAAAIWLALRVEAFAGGRGDRLVRGDPLWLAMVPTLSGAYLAAMVAAVIAGPGLSASLLPVATVSLALVAVYAMIGFYLMRTQLANRRPLGGWSVSGLCLTGLFTTCAVMHGVFAAYLMAGRYPVDPHNIAIGLVAIPAGIYFLWVVRALDRGTFVDWNGTPSFASGTRRAGSGPGFAAGPAAEPAHTVPLQGIPFDPARVG